MKRTVIVAAAMMAALFGVFIWAAAQKYLRMPLTFSATTIPEEALRKYPLGVVTRQAAFPHHGQATRSAMLPGNEGWVYQVGVEPACVHTRWS